MKILYFNYLWDLWGISIGSTIKGIKLMEALRAEGHDVKMFWRCSNDDEHSKGNEQLVQPTEQSGVMKILKKYLHEPSRIVKNYAGIWEEKKILEQEQPDMVISRLEIYNISPKIFSKKSNIPFLIEVDSPVSYEKAEYQKYFHSTKPIMHWMEEQFIKGGRHSFAQSNVLKEHFVNRGIPESSMSMLPNAADTNAFSPDLPHAEIDQKFNLGNSIVVGFVGSFIYWHGIENLTKILDSTMKSNPKVKFLMVGEGGPMRPQLEKFISDNNYQERAIFAGYVDHDELPNYIAAMDVVLAPYPFLEFFYYSPVKVFEYMASGKALVSTNIGQIAEIVDHGENGLLVSSPNIDEYTSHINRLVNDEQLRKSMGQKARQTIIDGHTWKHRGQALSQLCEKFA